jgi:uncharacterized protein
MSAIDFPFDIDAGGRVAVADEDDHVRDLIQQVLFTAPGERVNRPDFGCGLRQLVFEPNSDALATVTQFTVHGALQRWLSDVVAIEQVRIENREAELHVDVIYRRLDDGVLLRVEFRAP